MKFLLVTLFISGSVFAAKCPSIDNYNKKPYALYPEDQARELWLCKLTKGVKFKKLEFCVGRMSSTMISDYIGIGGVEEVEYEYTQSRLYSMHSSWVKLDGDKNGEATDTHNEMNMLDINEGDIMAEHDYRYKFSLNKKTGKATYSSERKKRGCIFCGPWKPQTSAELNCTLIK